MRPFGFNVWRFDTEERTQNHTRPLILQCENCRRPHVFPELIRYLKDVEVPCVCGELLHLNPSHLQPYPAKKRSDEYHKAA